MEQYRSVKHSARLTHLELELIQLYGDLVNKRLQNGELHELGDSQRVNNLAHVLEYNIAEV